MAVPKRKTSSTKTKLRRSHDALKTRSLASCPNCGESKELHRMCPHCHYYKGKLVLEVSE